MADTPFTGTQVLLRVHVEHLLDGLSPPLRTDMATALSQRGKLIAPNEQEGPISGSWALLTYLVARHFNPALDPDLAGRVAVVVELVICALDLLDDVEDGDDTPTLRLLGMPRALNCSTALLFVAQRAIGSLSLLGLADEIGQRMRATLEAAVLEAAGGQHDDLRAEHQDEASFAYTDCLEMARRKAGSLMRLACALGAQCAATREDLYPRICAFGENLGVAHQLDNDVHDLAALLANREKPSSPLFSATCGKTDLARGKKTMPLVLAASLRPHTPPARDWAPDQSDPVYETALAASWEICQLYRQQARALLQEVEERSEPMPLLRLLVML